MTNQADNEVITCTTPIARFKKGFAPQDYKSIIAAGQPWEDSTFNRNRSTSILWESFPKLNGPETENMYKKWRRLSAIEPEATLFGTLDGNNDVVQGALGDCYFLAGVHAYTEFPELFDRVFVTKNANAAGMYLFNVYIRGVPTVVAIDDFLPTYRKSLIYTKVSADKSTWVPLLEKAFAKVMGNYENIEGGNHAEAFKFLSNAPATKF